MTEHQTSVGPPNRSWRQAPDVCWGVKGDRRAKEEVVVVDVAGGACSMGLARFQLPGGGVRKPQSDLRRSDWRALRQRKVEQATARDPLGPACCEAVEAHLVECRVVESSS